MAGCEGKERVWRIIESIIVAGVIGLVMMYAASERISTKVTYVCESIGEIKSAQKELDGAMRSLSDKVTDHIARENARDGFHPPKVK